MWFYRLLLLLALIASWIPHESRSFSYNAYEEGTHHPVIIDYEEPEEQEDEGEELAA